MNSNKIVKAVAVAAENIEKVDLADRKYHRPQVHDLGSLDLVQWGTFGNYRDGPGARGYRTYL
jgi:hypothetical protein